MLHLKSIAHHRNGVCGVPFHVVLFRDGKDMMLGIKFDNETDQDGNESKNEIYTAVLNVAKLEAGDIDFGSNSYRGDEFDAQIRQWCKMYEAERSAEFEKEAAREARAQQTMREFAENELKRAA